MPIEGEKKVGFLAIYFWNGNEDFSFGFFKYCYHLKNISKTFEIKIYGMALVTIGEILLCAHSVIAVGWDAIDWDAFIES